MSKHTPGPWNWHDHIQPVIAIYAKDGTAITGPLYKDGKGVAVANHDLIAAAPELLEACLAVMRCLNGEYPGGREGEPPNPLAVIADRSIAKRKVELAIAKATGEAQ